MNKMGLEEFKGVYVFAQQVDNVLDGVGYAFGPWSEASRAAKRVLPAPLAPTIISRRISCGSSGACAPLRGGSFIPILIAVSARNLTNKSQPRFKNV